MYGAIQGKAVEKGEEHLTAIHIIEKEEREEYGKSELPEVGNGKPINSENIRETAAKTDERQAAGKHHCGRGIRQRREL